MSLKIKNIKQKQEAWLMNMLNRHKECAYGKLYGFKTIRNIEDYQRKVPLCTYKKIANFITAIARGGDDILFSGAPIAFEITGGSTSGGKLIPYTQAGFNDLQQSIIPWMQRTYTQYGLGGGTFYWAVSPVLRAKSKTPRGVMIGVSEADYLGLAKDTKLKQTHAIPPNIDGLSDFNQWQIATLYWLMCAKDLEFISVWSPTFLLVLLQALFEKEGQLREILKSGTLIEAFNMEPNQEALQRYDEYLKAKDTAILWPSLKLISCWRDGTSLSYYNKLKSYFPHVGFQPKGLISTEGIVTAPDAKNYPTLCVESGLYEFLDQGGNIFLADELNEGCKYEIVMSTNSGLYRYQTGDLVRFDGYSNGLPILYFEGRGDFSCDMVGEKLTEEFVRNALDGIDDMGMLVANEASIPHYLFISQNEKGAKKVGQVEKYLCQNPQYAYARKIGQLGELKSLVITDIAKHYMDYKITQGARLGDVKIPFLSKERGWIEYIKEITK